FILTATPPTDIYTLSLHDALPICKGGQYGADENAQEGHEEADLQDPDAYEVRAQCAGHDHLDRIQPVPDEDQDANPDEVTRSALRVTAHQQHHGQREVEEEHAPDQPRMVVVP